MQLFKEYFSRFSGRDRMTAQHNRIPSNLPELGASAGSQRGCDTARGAWLPVRMLQALLGDSDSSGFSLTDQIYNA